MIRLSRLAAQMKLKKAGEGDPEFLGMTEDSREVKPGFLFAAIKGAKFNGRDYVKQALENGAAAVLLSEADMDLPVPRLIAPAGDIRAVMAGAAAGIYGRPADKLIMVGLTGTNGKTTTAYLVEEILKKAGLAPGVMGTINYRWPNHCVPAPNTTPEGPKLFATLASMMEDGAKSAVLEISSHALALGRVRGLAFDAALFTNLSRDHLDFHEDMETYFQAKKTLFQKYLRPGDKKAAINIDDEYGARLAKELGGAALSFGFDDKAEVRGSNLKLSREGLSLTISHKGKSWEQKSPLLAEINAYNILGAAALALAMHIDKRAIQAALETSTGAPGRLEKVGTNRDFLVLVDYAHSPDALAKALEGCRALGPKRLIAVFGCGGDRDRGKRPIMGKIAGELADMVIITSDNPRTENPEMILREIEEGMDDSAPRRVIPERGTAIFEAVRLMEPGDILLIAGKGHEDYQIIGREKRFLDDRAEALTALQRMGRT